MGTIFSELEQQTNEELESATEEVEKQNDTSVFEDDTSESENDANNRIDIDTFSEGEFPTNLEEEDSLSQKSEDNEIDGKPVTLRGPEFNQIVETFDVTLNRIIRTLRNKKQSEAEVNVKITVNDSGTSVLFGGQVSGKINYIIKPAKVYADEIEIKLDEHGDPVIPYDREHQLSFEEICQEQGATVTTDASGVVESIETVSDASVEEPEDCADIDNLASLDQEGDLSGLLENTED